MPEIKLYITKEDAKALFTMLNQEQELAFLLEGKDYDWQAYYICKELQNCAIWYMPSGPIPVHDQVLKDVRWIRNPFNGWDQRLNPSMVSTYASEEKYPNTAGSPDIFHFRYHPIKDDVLGMSEIYWRGNRDSELGIVAKESTKKYWSKLKRLIGKLGSKKVTAKSTDKKAEVYALPEAYAYIENGGTKSHSLGYNTYIFNPTYNHLKKK